MKNPKHYADSVNIILNYQLNSKGKTMAEIEELFNNCRRETLAIASSYITFNNQELAHENVERIRKDIENLKTEKA